MGVLFQDDFLDGFGTWPLAYISFGGPTTEISLRSPRRSAEATLAPITRRGPRQVTGPSLRGNSLTEPDIGRAHKNCF